MIGGDNGGWDMMDYLVGFFGSSFGLLWGSVWFRCVDELVRRVGGREVVSVW